MGSPIDSIFRLEIESYSVAGLQLTFNYSSIRFLVSERQTDGLLLRQDILLIKNFPLMSAFIMREREQLLLGGSGYADDGTKLLMEIHQRVS